MTELLDIHEAARYLTVSERTIYREIQRGRLRVVKMGGTTRFRRAELDRYIRAAERHTAA